MLKIFLDASVIFAGAHSQSGGSRRICELCRTKIISALTTQTVIEELKDNSHKLKIATSIEQFVAKHKIAVFKRVSHKEVLSLTKFVDIKDAHIIAGTISTGCKIIVTLDKKHLNNSKTKNNFPDLTIVSPKEFLQKIL